MSGGAATRGALRLAAGAETESPAAPEGARVFAAAVDEMNELLRAILAELRMHRPSAAAAAKEHCADRTTPGDRLVKGKQHPDIAAAEYGDWVDFFAAVSALRGDEMWTSGELLDDAWVGSQPEHARLRAALRTLNLGRNDAKRLGKRLAPYARAGRPIAGFEVTRADKPTREGARWWSVRRT